MAKRRKKSSEEDALGGLMLFISIFVFYKSHSITLGIITFLLLIVILVSYIIIKNLIKEKRLTKSGIREIDKMNGEHFEDYLIALFKKLGYHAKGTPKSNDYGADLILNDKNGRIVVQAKRYKSNVGIKAVQEAISAKSYYKADRAWVVTNSFFTPQAINLAKSSDVRLIDRETLQDLILKTIPDTNVQKAR